MTDFSTYSDRVRGLGSDSWLGSLAWFSVSESVSIDHAEFTRRLTAAGLDRAFLPPPPRDDDVFRRVCTTAQRKRVPTAAGTFENVLVRDVSREKNTVTKNIVVEEVDAANKRLSYSPVHQVAFDGTQIISGYLGVSLPGGSTAADATLADIRSGYDAQKGKLNSYAIREVIRRVLGRAQATTVRSGGGVYFVMADHVHHLAALEQLAGLIDGVSVHALPLIDDIKQRKMVKEAFEAETVGEIDRRLGEIDTILNGPEIPESRFLTLNQEMQDLIGKAETYSDLLEESMGNAEFRMQVYRKKMGAVLNHVKD